MPVHRIGIEFRIHARDRHELQRRAVEDSLHGDWDTARALLSALPDGLFVVADGRIRSVNRGLCAAVVGLVVGFGSSDHLAAADGIAVTGTLAIDTLLFFFVVRALWHRPAWLAVWFSSRRPGG